LRGAAAIPDTADIIRPSAVSRNQNGEQVVLLLAV
jgi:hypothetical protein